MTPWPGIRRGTLWTVPIVPGLVSVIVAPWKSLDGQLVASDLADQVLVGSEEPGEVERVGVAQHRHDERALPSPLSTSTARPMLTCSLRTRRGLPSAPVDERVVHRRHVIGDGPDDGVADEVGEADLALTAAAAVAVDDLAVDLEQLGRNVAEAGGRRHRRGCAPCWRRSRHRRRGWDRQLPPPAACGRCGSWLGRRARCETAAGDVGVGGGGAVGAAAACAGL